jgi:hypothetical protein
MGQIDIFTAPFDAAPLRLFKRDPVGVVIAPNGDLIVAAEFDGIWVYDPPFSQKSHMIARETYPSGILLFDSTGRLFDVDSAGFVNVFNPPYNSKPVVQFGFPSPTYGVYGASIDEKNTFFATGVNNQLYDCLAPHYNPCWSFRSGTAVAVNKASRLFTGVPPHDALAEFASPFSKTALAKASLPFTVTAVAPVTNGGVAVAGWHDATIYLAAFNQSITGRRIDLPIEQYFQPQLQFWVAKNHDLFVSDETPQHEPCVAVYHYPYTNRPYRCIAVRYHIQAVYAQ